MRTIVANATPLINSAIHIIRVSGPDTFSILNKVLENKIKPEPNTIQRNKIIYNNEIIDDVILCVYVKPKSFTGEDTVEINCHGNVYLTKKIIDIILLNGAEYAEPGEFSMQAMLNNKMNYSQIEAMNNLINSKNELARKFSISSLLGNDIKKIEDLRKALFLIMGSIEVNIDYPEYDDVPEMTHEQILATVKPLKNKLETIYTNSTNILPIFDGFKIAIVGEPNVGKSSLLNYLSKDEKAIVSDIKGTTRDVIESSITIKGISIKLYDTAGVRKAKDEIEAIGVKKSLDTIDKADLIIWLLDAKTKKESATIKNKLKTKQFIKVYNKSDIAEVDGEINISIKNNDIEQLISAIANHLEKYNNISLHDNLILQSDRQIQLLKSIINELDNVIHLLETKESLDLIQIYFEKIINSFNKILGIDFEYDKLDELFKNFCLGK